MAQSSGNFGSGDEEEDEGYEPEHADQTTPRTPMLLWIILFVIVVLMVVWSIRKFGTRSSAAVQPVEWRSTSDGQLPRMGNA